MPAAIERVVRTAIASLEAERDRIGRQISALQSALTLDGARRPRGAQRATSRRRRRRRFSTAARNAASARMKAYWANRKREQASKKSR
ncbi:MAG TPA: hypothetical protein VGL09_03795 [Methylomirabilota bacterium]|jgi:hypothetical protein